MAEAFKQHNEWHVRDGRRLIRLNTRQAALEFVALLERVADLEAQLDKKQRRSTKREPA